MPKHHATTQLVTVFIFTPQLLCYLATPHRRYRLVSNKTILYQLSTALRRRLSVLQAVDFLMWADGLRVFENRRRIFGPKRDEVTGEWRKLHSEEIHNLFHPQISLGKSSQGE
jgi:hypothetical protein